MEEIYLIPELKYIQFNRGCEMVCIYFTTRDNVTLLDQELKIMHVHYWMFVGFRKDRGTLYNISAGREKKHNHYDKAKTFLFQIMKN